MDSDYNRLLREVEEATDGYNGAVYDAITQDLESLADNLSDEYFFSEDVRSGDAAQDVYDWIRENAPVALEEMVRDPELVAGHDAVWKALEALRKVEPWHSFDEEDALGMDIRDYERWKASRGDPTEESVCEGLVSTRKNYLETDKISQEVFDAIEDADPTKQKKYMDWMAGQASKLSDPKGPSAVAWVQVDAHRVVSQFHQALEKNQIPKDKRDIYSMSFTDVVQVIRDLPKETKTQKKKRVKVEGADKVLDSDRFLVYEVYSHDAVSYYGSGTKWCIASDYGSGSEYWDEYSEQGIWFYVVILEQDLIMPDEDEDDEDYDPDVGDVIGSEGDKFAITMSSPNSFEIFDQEDNQVDSEIADWFMEQILDDGADISDHQPVRVEYGPSEGQLEREREERYENWYVESQSEIERDLERHWSDPDEEMELDDGTPVTYTEEYLERLEDDAERLASDVLQAAREWADNYRHDCRDTAEEKARRDLSYQFDEAGDEDGGYLSMRDEQYIYVLADMDYLEEVSGDATMNAVVKFLQAYKEQPNNYQVDDDAWDTLRRRLTDSEYSDVSSAQARAMDREELVAAALEAVKKYKEDLGRRDAPGQKKFGFAERRLMKEMLGLLG